MRKTHVALLAMVRLLSGVQEEVRVTFSLGSVHLIAKQTRVRFLAFVPFQMRGQRGLNGERVHANVTLERFFSGVRPSMIFKVFGAFEELPTCSATIRSLSFVYFPQVFA